MTYAANTKVPVERTKGEIERLLTKEGADQFHSGWTAGKAVIMFRLEDRFVRIEMPLPEYMKTQNAKGIFLGQEQIAQETRRRWRSMLLYIKGKLDSIESGIVTFENAFMAHIVLPNRQTVAQFMQPQIDASYRSGDMPKQLEGY